MKIKQFNDILALVLAAGVFPALWAFQGIGWLTMPPEVVSATVILETLIVQFYFRKALESATK